MTFTVRTIRLSGIPAMGRALTARMPAAFSYKGVRMDDKWSQPQLVDFRGSTPIHINFIVTWTIDHR